MTTDQLLEAYGDGLGACCQQIIGQEVRARQDEIGSELLRRGVTHLPNYFGDIPIRNTWTLEAFGTQEPDIWTTD